MYSEKLWKGNGHACHSWGVRWSQKGFPEELIGDLGKEFPRRKNSTRKAQRLETALRTEEAAFSWVLCTELSPLLRPVGA